MSKDLNEVIFSDLLPSSIAFDEKILVAAKALQVELRSINVAIEKIRLYSAIDGLPEELLKHLAWQWHVDFWDDALSIDAKRTLVKQAYPWHRRKGTPAAVEEVIRDVLGGGYLQEWWEYNGQPYHFRVFSNSPPEDAEKNTQLLLAIEMAKNKRSKLDKIIKFTVMNGDLILAGTVMAGTTLTIFSE